MTEKQYGGSSSHNIKEKSDSKVKNSNQIKNKEKPIKPSNLDNSSSDLNEEIDSEVLNKLKKAGKISIEAKTYAKSIIKLNMPLLEIAEKIEKKIEELGAKPA